MRLWVPCRVHKQISGCLISFIQCELNRKIIKKEEIPRTRTQTRLATQDLQNNNWNLFTSQTDDRNTKTSQMTTRLQFDEYGNRNDDAHGSKQKHRHRKWKYNKYTQTGTAYAWQFIPYKANTIPQTVLQVCPWSYLMKVLNKSKYYCHHTSVCCLSSPNMLLKETPTTSIHERNAYNINIYIYIITDDKETLKLQRPLNPYAWPE
jgi:hypothetical protein